MRRFGMCRRWLGLIWLLCGCVLAAHAEPDEAAARAQLKQLQKEMAELHKVLEQFKGERDRVQDALRSSEVDIGELQKRIRELRQQLDSQQQSLRELEQRQTRLTEQRRAQQKIIGEQVRAAYQLGREKKLKVLLNQEQPERVSRALTYYDYFNRARSDQIAQYLDVIAELDTLKPAIETRVNGLARARDELGKRRDQLVASQQNRQRSLALLEKTISSKDQQLKRFQRERAELEKLLAAVEQAIADIQLPASYQQPFTSLKGKLPWPVKGQLKNRFGSQREGRMRWQGINIAATAGSEVRAVHHGRVVFADWFKGMGMLIIVDHGEGYISLYAHNQSLLRDTGDWVSAGETIATVGNSGGQSQAALYFEIRRNGEPTNPQVWMARA